MGRKKKSKIEFRYYRMPEDIPFLALLGEKWVQYYGRDVDYLHFHNYLEIGYCYSGTGTLVLGEENYRFTGNQFSVIPKNYPHTTDSDSDTVSKWEYIHCCIFPAPDTDRSDCKDTDIPMSLNHRSFHAGRSADESRS